MGREADCVMGCGGSVANAPAAEATNKPEACQNAPEKDAPPKAAQEDPSAAPKYGEDHEQAALKIQCAQRTKVAVARVEEKRQARPGSAPAGKVQEKVAYGEDHEQAALKIQCAQRTKVAVARV